MSDDDTRQAEPGDEPETTSVPTSAAPTPELAWSADDGDDESQRRSWPRTAALATGIVAAGAAIGAGLWLAVPGFKTTVTNHVVPQHSTTTTVAAAPSTTPPTVTVVKPSVPPVLSADDRRLLYQLRSVEGYEADNPALVVAHAHRYCELIQQGFSGYQAWQGVVSSRTTTLVCTSPSLVRCSALLVPRQRWHGTYSRPMRRLCTRTAPSCRHRHRRPRSDTKMAMECRPRRRHSYS